MKRAALALALLSRALLADRPEIADQPATWTAPPYWAPPAVWHDELAARAAQSGRQPLVGGPTALPFIALPPCRVADTRGNGFTGAYGPPSVGGGVARTFTITGQCGIPADAQAVSFNFTVWNTLSYGNLTVYPAGGAAPVVSTLNWNPGVLAIANAAVVPLGTGGNAGQITVVNQSGNTIDVFCDVNGYYSAQGVVNKVNGLTGDVTLAAGANVTLTPSGSTLTIASTASGGPPTGPAGGSLSGSYPNPGIADAAVTDAKIAGVSWGKVTGAPGFVLRAGDTMTGSVALSPGNIYLTASSSASTGSIFKNGVPFLHDFGTWNTFVGLSAGNFTMTGGFNTAAGSAALFNNTTGNSNTAEGYFALRSNTTGSDNTASGYGALVWNTTGSDNTASGYGALFSNTTGDQNTAVGHLSLYGNTTGFQNTALGDNAGNASGASIGYGGGAITYVPIGNGRYNTFLGQGTGATAANISNCTAVGIGAYCDGHDQVRLGNIFVGSIGGNVGWSALSDARAKRDIRDLSHGLDFVLGLRPVEYRLKIGNGRTDMGFLAQDVEALLGRGYNVVTVGGDPDRTLSLRYTDLIAPLVKAIQEQQAMYQAHEAMQREQLEARDARIAQLERRLAVLEERVTLDGSRR